MARKNRKKMEGFTIPIPFAGLAAVAAVLGLVYIWLGCRCEALGREIKALELSGAELKARLVFEEARWASRQSPHGIQSALSARKIDMSYPRRDQTVRLSDAHAFRQLPGDASAYVVNQESARAR
jgi:hypothetical protein